MRNKYDDPYTLLAHHIISISNNAEKDRLLKDDEYVLRKIIVETRGQDFNGPYLDCIIGSILEDKERMEMCHELDKLARYFFSKLDLPRLRAKVSEYWHLYFEM